MKKLFALSAIALVVASVSFAEVDPRAMPIIQDIQQGRNNNNAIDNLYVKGDATIGDDLVVSGDIAADAIVLSGDLSVDDLTVGDDLVVTGDVSAANITLTGDAFVADDLTVGDDLVVTGDVSAATLDVSSTSQFDGKATFSGGLQVDAGEELTVLGSLRLSPLDIDPAEAQVLTNSYPVTRFYAVTLPTVTNTLLAPGASDAGTLWTMINISTSVVTISEGSTAALGAASRDLSQYDSLLLMAADATKWVEVSFSDN